MRDFNRWLKQYDQKRTNPFEPNENWISTKFDIQGISWEELQDIYIPELEMCWGPACSALKKSWYAFIDSKKRGESPEDLAWRINDIQNAMGIPITVFEEYPYRDGEKGAENPEEEDEDDAPWESL